MGGSTWADLAIAVILAFSGLLLITVAAVEICNALFGRRRPVEPGSAADLERMYAAPPARCGDYPFQDWCPSRRDAA